MRLIFILLFLLTGFAQAETTPSPEWLVRVQSDYVWTDSSGAAKTTTIAGWGVVVYRKFDNTHQKYFIYTASHLTGGQNLRAQTISGKNLTVSATENLTDANTDSALFEIRETIQSPLEVDMQNNACEKYINDFGIRVDYSEFNKNLDFFKRSCTQDNVSCYLLPKNPWTSNPQITQVKRLWNSESQELEFLTKPGFSGSPIFNLFLKATDCKRDQKESIAWRGLVSGYHPFYGTTLSGTTSLEFFKNFFIKKLRGFANQSRWEFDGNLIKKIEDQVFERAFNTAGNATRADGGNATRADGGNATRADGGNATRADGGGLTTLKDYPLGMMINGQQIQAFRLESDDGRLPPGLYAANEANYLYLKKRTAELSLLSHFKITTVPSSDFRHEDLFRTDYHISNYKEFRGQRGSYASLFTKDLCTYVFDKRYSVVTVRISTPDYAPVPVRTQFDIPLLSLNKKENYYSDYTVRSENPNQIIDFYHLLFLDQANSAERLVRVRDTKLNAIVEMMCYPDKRYLDDITFQ